MTSTNQTDGSGIERGIYLAADTPRSFTPLALEGGAGDKQLLADALAGILTDEEVEELVSELGGGLE